IWYSLSVSVWLGATTMLSPVCTPIGSKFSMLQIVMQLSAPSRIISYSSSFQPRRLRSTSTCVIGLAASPPSTMRRYCSSVGAIPPPGAPRGDAASLLRVVRDPAAGAAQRVGGPDDQRQADALAYGLGFLHRRHGLGL